MTRSSVVSRYDGALRYLYEELGPGRGPGTPHRAGTDRAHALLHRLDRPQDAVPTVHVAGTAGKGSVCAFTAAILEAHGFRVGAHLSPHAYSLLERFRIDGRPASTTMLVDELDRIRPAVDSVVSAGLGLPTFFEVTNAIAFGLFAGRVDYSVIETGIGGLHDSTNVISRSDKLAVLTPIGLDHTEVLGDTLSEIATQKAGILPHDGQAISHQNGADIDAVIADEAARRRSTVDFVDPARAIRDARMIDHRTMMRLPGLGEFPLGLAGRHQVGNAVLALRAVAALARRDGWVLTMSGVHSGLAHASLPGRFERRSLGGRTVILDGAHNALKLASVAAALSESYPDEPATWVLAFKHDKDLAAALRAIAPTAGLVVATEFRTDGGDHPASWSRSAADVADAARAAGIRSVVGPCPTDALARAHAATPAGAPVVISGSFHLLSALDAATAGNDRTAGSP